MVICRVAAVWVLAAAAAWAAVCHAAAWAAVCPEAAWAAVCHEAAEWEDIKLKINNSKFKIHNCAHSFSSLLIGGGKPPTGSTFRGWDVNIRYVDMTRVAIC